MNKLGTDSPLGFEIDRIPYRDSIRVMTKVIALNYSTWVLKLGPTSKLYWQHKAASPLKTIYFMCFKCLQFCPRTYVNLIRKVKRWFDYPAPLFFSKKSHLLANCRKTFRNIKHACMQAHASNLTMPQENN